LRFNIFVTRFRMLSPKVRVHVPWSPAIMVLKLACKYVNSILTITFFVECAYHKTSYIQTMAIWMFGQYSKRLVVSISFSN
jgi:hypothetical protein